MDRLMDKRSMIRELGNGGLWAVMEVALMPCTQAFDYEHEHRPLRRTEHEHDRILWSRRPELVNQRSTLPLAKIALGSLRPKPAADGLWAEMVHPGCLALQLGELSAFAVSLGRFPID